jgi:hypothetical protein
VDEPFGYLPKDGRRAGPPEAWLRWSVAADLVAEIGAWIARPKILPAGAEDARDDALPWLSAIAAIDLAGTEAIDPASPLGAFLLETVALVRAVAWNHVSKLEVLPPFLLLSKRPRLYFRVRALANRLFDRAFPGGDAEASAHRRAAKRELARTFTRLSNLDADPDLPIAGAVPALLRDPLASIGLALDDELAVSRAVAE